MRIVALTQKGPNKKENEDRIIVGKTILDDGFLCSNVDEGIIAIADGVGGNNAGAAASNYVASRLSKLMEVSIEQFESINDELIAISEKNESQKGMATTLSGFLIRESKSQLFSIGNTRVYLVQSGKYLKQLTKDDTTLNYLLDTGQLQLENIDKFKRKNEITACFGGGTKKLFKLKINEIVNIDSPILMTSDGIHDHLSVDEMENILSKYGISKETCEQMISESRAKGSMDDASIILGE